MSEATVQAGLIAAFRAMAEFEDADITLNDWDVLDGNNDKSPYVIFEISDDFEATQVTVTPETVWNIPFTLCERFTDWADTLTNLRDRRQAIIDKINTTTVRTAGGLDGVDVRRIHNAAPVDFMYDRNLDPELIDLSMPVFVIQKMIAEVLER